MKTKLITNPVFIFTWILFLSPFLKAQDNNYGVKGYLPKTFDITGSGSIDFNGLRASYQILQTDLDSKKENQSRYKILFSLTNISSDAKIMFQNPNFSGHIGDISPDIARFTCTNATGARLTNKQVSIKLRPLKVWAKVEDKDTSGKTVINKKFVEIGYWLQPGEILSKTELMYVSKGETPQINITFNPEMGNQSGTVIGSNSQSANPGSNRVRIQNLSNNSFLNNQTGFLMGSSVNLESMSGQWEILPGSSPNLVLIRNLWKGTFLSNSTGFLSNSPDNTSSLWQLEEAGAPNVFYLKSAYDGSYLILVNNKPETSKNYIANDNSNQWRLEKI